jgi:predicted TIM-barrel fold metal-dependent hydrolase
MKLSQIPAIDVHGHYGTYHRSQFTDLVNTFMSGDAATIVRLAKLANIEQTVVSPLLGLLPRGQADAEKGNEEAVRIVEKTEGLLQWVIIDPRRPKTYQQAEWMLKLPKCVGIKIHGEEHCYSIGEYGEPIFEFAAAHQAVVLTHSGEENTRPADFVPLADRHPQVKLILGHMGNCGEPNNDPSHQVRAIQASKHGNIFTDTSSISSILPGLIEWAVAEVGPEHILFGTDSPLYFTCSQRVRIDNAELSEAQKRMILRDNAVKLLGLEKKLPTQ